MKVVINGCYGGFGLSYEGAMRYFEIKGIKVWPEFDEKFKSMRLCTYWTVPHEQRPKEVDFYSLSMDERKAYNESYRKTSIYPREIERNDPALVQVVEEMGDKANGDCAKLEIVEIPDGVEWQIEEYDGNEHVAEVHRTWR